jgi:hypothetical protein
LPTLNADGDGKIKAPLAVYRMWLVLLVFSALRALVPPSLQR